MKRLLLIVICLLIMASTAAYCADRQTKSSGIQLTDTGVRVMYIYDKHSYGLAAGGTVVKGSQFGIPQLHVDAIGVIQPANDNQIAAGIALGYDFKLFKNNNFTFSPIIGILTDITSGYDGKATLPFIGGSITITFK